jgi:nucleotide-binding universal stress UspA family protein
MSDANVVAPSSLLLATDLSARGDRAFDRAVQLARQWQARLVVVTVLPSTQELDFHDPILGSPPWQRPAVLSQLVERRLRRDLAVDDIDLDVQIASGAVGPALLRTAQAKGCALLIAGVARNALFTQPSLGSSVAWLSRHATMPLLVVHRRVHGAYRSMAWASDLSDTATHALQVALDLFGDPLALAALHAFQVPRLGQRDTHAAAAQAQARDRAQDALHARLETLDLPPSLRGRLQPVVAEGEPSRLLRDYVRDHETDLVVVGGHGRSALSGLLLGDTAGRILNSVQTDTLFVRDRGEVAARIAS